MPATGEQHVLRLEADGREVVGVVAELAASLRRVVVDGTDIVQDYGADALPSGASGIVLVPWPNRVRDGRWTLDGKPQQLDLTEPSKGNASHGLLRNTGYRVTDRSESAITLSATVFPQHGWPFHLDTSVRYELTPTGIAITHGVHNVGTGTAPFGVGCHPYLRVGDTPMRDLVVTVSGMRMLETDERSLPVREVPVTPERDLRAGAALRDLDLDTAYTGLEVVDGAVRHRLTAPDGRAVELAADPVFAWTQVFTNDVYDTDDGRIDAVAIEPMTCPPDALNSGEGLIRLEPGEQWVAGWRLSLLTP
ncbi:aldose 1-epimerase family protein [Amnibacterium setariae]|uniref:Aldose epimerase n=1 Tax=Amnibacterium setariae TaxID=2306585 RepID=A0A3A1U4N9_9MICO|nr:aldose 1-epimerase family protein [Amnibacterium setariae]RIX30417.1 aldose epimerase [Amnibacterium setariae]